MHLRPSTHLATLALAVGLSLLAASPGSAAMQSTKLDRHFCETVGGGRFAEIPGYPGEYIDRRLIPDIRWMKRRARVAGRSGRPRATAITRRSVRAT